MYKVNDKWFNSLDEAKEYQRTKGGIIIEMSSHK